MSDFGKLVDSIKAGKRAEAKLATMFSGPIVSPMTKQISSQHKTTDMVSASLSAAINLPPQFVWNVSAWGDEKRQVGE